MLHQLQQPLEGSIEDNDVIPNVWDFLNKTYISIMEFSSFTKYPIDYKFMRQLSISHWEAFAMLFIALLFTLARRQLDRLFINPLMLKIQLRTVDRQKFAESFWKALVYGIMWILCFNIVILTDHDIFHYTCRIWNNVTFDDDYFIRRIMPWKFKLLYWLQVGFYTHSVYATVYMDVWRKDSMTMLIHHALAVSLLLISYAARYHGLGSLIIFLHDINDIILELTKLNVYLKLRGGKFHKLNDYLAAGGFLSFAACWVYTRLYLYPLKVLHATNWCAYIYHKGKSPNLWMVLNSMLWPLLFMHIYWFGFILQLLFRVFTGRMSQLDDNRDFSIESETQTKSVCENK